MTMIDHEHGKKNVNHDESTFMYPKLIFGIAKLTKHYKAKVQTATQCTILDAPSHIYLELDTDWLGFESTFFGNCITFVSPIQGEPCIGLLFLLVIDEITLYWENKLSNDRQYKVCLSLDGEIG